MRNSNILLFVLFVLISSQSYSYASTYLLTQEQYQELKLTIGDSKNQLILLQNQLQTAEQSVQTLSEDLNIANQYLMDYQNQITKLNKQKTIIATTCTVGGFIVGVGLTTLILYMTYNQRPFR